MEKKTDQHKLSSNQAITEACDRLKICHNEKRSPTNPSEGIIRKRAEEILIEIICDIIDQERSIEE